MNKYLKYSLLGLATLATLGATTSVVGPGSSEVVFYAKNFKGTISGTFCTWDSTHDVSDCINAAITAAGAAGGGKVIVPTGVYGTTSTVVNGNGTTSALSTINAVVVEGHGQPFERVNLASSLGTTGTILKWIGSAGGTMAQVKGPSAGNAFRNIGFDGNSSAATCLQLLSARNGTYNQVACANYTSKGFDLTTQSASSGLSDNSQFSTANNSFIAPLAWSATDGAIAFSLDGYLGDGVTDGKNASRNHFTNPVQAMTGAGSSIGFRLAFADQNVISNLTTIAVGSNDGTSCGVKLEGVVTTPSAFKFPQINVFAGQVDLGSTIGVCSSGTPGEGNRIENYDLLSGGLVPRDPVTKYLNFNSISTGVFPAGGYWANGGQNVLERSLRNKFINPTFARATRGTTFTSPVTTSYLMDQWKITWDGTQTSSHTRGTFTLAQTDVPYEPKYYLSMSWTAVGGGATFNQISQPIESVLTFAGRSAVASAWIKYVSCASPPAINAFAFQNFGTGGSPSSSVQTNTSNQTLTTSWVRYAWKISVPSISGKTLGTNGDDRIHIGWALPLSLGAACEIDIAQPQFEAGEIDTAFEVRPISVDETMAARYLKLVGGGAVGAVNTAAQVWLGVPFTVPMRAIPSASSATGVTTVTVNTPGSGDLTTTGTATYATTNSTVNGAQIFISTFSGLTAFRPIVGKSDQILLSAEY